MKTYPNVREDGSIKAFSISNAFCWSLVIRKLLYSVEGVSEVRANWFSQDHYSFVYLGRDCVVNEPWGDNDRYWIYPVDMEPPLDLEPIHNAFRKFRFLFTFDREFRE